MPCTYAAIIGSRGYTYAFELLFELLPGVLDAAAPVLRIREIW